MKEPKDITVLIAEDEPVLRAAIEFDFKLKGFKVLAASNGAEALDLVKKNKIDIVLSDVRMPGGDGIELLDKIRDINIEVPVVMFITGFSEITPEEAYAKGVDAMFTKPFDRKELMGLVMRKVLTKNEAWGERKEERFDINYEVRLVFPELDLAIKGRVLNIGRGGIFVALDESFPNVGAKAYFNIEFNRGELGTIEGHGVVRWVRTRVNEARLSGCGIEFEHLEDRCRLEVISLIRGLRTKSLIPRE